MMHPLFEQLLAPFLAPLYQKTAKTVRMTEKEKIQVEEWGFDLPGDLGWFTLYLFRSSWQVEVECYKKTFFPWEFQEFCKEQGYKYADFDEWWNSWTTPMQRVIVEEFIRANDTTLQTEIDAYIAKLA